MRGLVSGEVCSFSLHSLAAVGLDEMSPFDAVVSIGTGPAQVLFRQPSLSVLEDTVSSDPYCLSTPSSLTFLCTHVCWGWHPTVSCALHFDHSWLL